MTVQSECQTYILTWTEVRIILSWQINTTMAELHRELVSWLNQFKVVPNGSPAVLSNSSLSDVIAVLRDGVVLCQLVHSLDPSSVDMTK